MTRKEETQAVEALIAWLNSQEIKPIDAVPIMAKVMVCAVINMVRRSPTGSFADVTRGVEKAMDLLPDALADMIETGRLDQHGR